GVKKEQKLMVVKGSYQGLLMFLRQLEWITPLLVISDLSLEAGQEQTQTKLKFTLAAYSRK
ncbi:MAG: GspMb/PilO family protein, partial [Synechococcus sp. LacPavin_0920_WC12_MAG_50_7]|nr:GspMb/PilO family protein [Synechococcus sp. LacPavin_0920_WC12_MAG_50_7]